MRERKGLKMPPRFSGLRSHVHGIALTAVGISQSKGSRKEI